MSVEYEQLLWPSLEAYYQDEEVKVLTSGNTEVFVSSRGGMVLGWRVAGTDVLLPLQFVQIKMRGGIPILFPIAGPGDKEGKFPELEQHGFARELMWQELGLPLSPDEAVMELHANEQTKEIYPHKFGLSGRIEVGEGVLRYEIGVANNGEEEMPFVLGLHPYFQLPSLEVIKEIRTNISNFDPEIWALQKSLIRNCPDEDIFVEIPGWGLITMTPSPKFKKLVVWTDAKAPYLCVEPWTSGPFTIDNKEERMTLAPKEAKVLTLEMQFQPA